MQNQAINKYQDSQNAHDTNLKNQVQANGLFSSKQRTQYWKPYQFSKSFSSRLELKEKIKHKTNLNADAKPIWLTYKNMNYNKRKIRKKLSKMHCVVDGRIVLCLYFLGVLRQVSLETS